MFTTRLTIIVDYGSIQEFFEKIVIMPYRLAKNDIITIEMPHDMDFEATVSKQYFEMVSMSLVALLTPCDFASQLQQGHTQKSCRDHLKYIGWTHVRTLKTIAAK